MIKPDGVQRGLVGEIIRRFESRGYKIAALKMTHASEEHLEKHYKDLKGKKFFPGLIKYMASGPVVCIVFEGKDAVRTGRVLLGATNPLDSAPVPSVVTLPSTSVATSATAATASSRPRPRSPSGSASRMLPSTTAVLSTLGSTSKPRTTLVVCATVIHSSFNT